MKSIRPLLIGVLIGAFLVSAGLGGFVFALIAAFGLLSIIVLIALIWTYCDTQTHSQQQAKESGDEKSKT